ncbi:cytochrome c oxidase subunit 4 [Kitasatospora sp. NPDC052896]|uniref:aa3-type cytochrome oxidase subunit IV n=1 Tax=Kitasatospora sp. NPDC052896 TaxID=3364061 RepID=UPI0037CBCCF3
MRTEAALFAAVAVFFAVAGGIYDAFAKEPAGKAALAVAFLMTSLIAVFFYVQYRRTGARAQDREEAEIVDTTGPLAFFSPRSGYPPLLAAGAALTGLGVVLGLWLFLIGVVVLALGVFGFVFQYRDRG